MDCLLDDGVVAPAVVNRVAGEKIEVGVPVRVVEVRAFRPGVNAVKAKRFLHLDERAVEVLAVEVVVVAHAFGDKGFQVKGHGG